MALTYRTSAVGGNTTTGTSPTAVITPVVGDLFLVFVQVVGGGSAPTCTDDNSSGAYKLLFTETSNASANNLSCFVRTTLLGSTASTTVTVATGAHTAAEVCVVAVSGAPVAGVAAIRQSGGQVNQAGGTTPAPVLSSNIFGADLVLSAVGNATNPAGVTVSANTVPFTWTRNQNVGQTGCGLAVESAPAQAIAASLTATWGSTSASVFASCVVEVCAGASNAGVNASKLVSYGVVAPPIGVDASKLVSYGILAPPVGVVCSKLVAYAVLNATNTNPPVWPVISPPAGYVGNPYLLQWDLTTAASPTTFTLFSGSLPPGLSLSNVVGGDGNQGEISGTPTTVGSYSFVITATNAYGTANEPMTIVISLAMSVNSAFVFIG